MIARRTLLMGAASLLACGALRAEGAACDHDHALISRDEVAEIERRSGGRLGFAVLDTGTGRRSVWRGEERFAMTSTFKFLLAGLVLKRVDDGKEALERAVPVGPEDIVVWSPVVETRIGREMTIAELCHATVTRSDNAAANLLLASMGGPASFTAMMRQLGDRHTRLDRIEPDLNEALAGDPRDTTTPSAMLGNLERFLIAGILSSASTAILTDWLVANTTGDHRIRAGVPEGWIVGDKTGTGRNGMVADVGIIFPPQRAPVLIAVYVTETRRAVMESSALHAELARAVSGRIGGC